LGIKSERQGTEGWAWRLPEGEGKRTERDHEPADDRDAHLDHVDHLQDAAQGKFVYFGEDDQGDQDDHGGHDAQARASNVRASDWRVTDEQAARIKRLVAEGWDWWRARDAVLDQGDPDVMVF
jgi:hypothetical protein